VFRFSPINDRKSRFESKKDQASVIHGPRTLQYGSATPQFHRFDYLKKRSRVYTRLPTNPSAGSQPHPRTKRKFRESSDCQSLDS
jgi:hypothetical protein